VPSKTTQPPVNSAWVKSTVPLENTAPPKSTLPWVFASAPTSSRDVYRHVVRIATPIAFRDGEDERRRTMGELLGSLSSRGPVGLGRDDRITPPRGGVGLEGFAAEPSPGLGAEAGQTACDPRLDALGTGPRLQK